jgi:DNA-binding NtrC family response regulator
MSENLTALVVDDDPQVRGFIAEVLREDGWRVNEAENAEHVFEMSDEESWGMILCDVMLGGADGFAVLRHFLKEQPQTQIVLMTGYGSAAGALDATALGAYDYLLKPFSVNEVLSLSGNLRRRLGKQKCLPNPDDGSNSRAYKSDIALIGQSAVFLEMMKLVGRIAPTNLPVLITGESGTGKEVVARAIHLRSRRAAHPFVTVNCGAMPAELIESELFGHVRGSFTGAERDRPGLFEEAHGGTIFLDEITETSQAFQVKLLRTLQEGEIRRVGANKTTEVNVRVIAASNRNVEEEVKGGRFRQDLLYRLNAVSLRLPPLRERREDIRALSYHFVERVRDEGVPPLGFSPEAMQILEAYSWPGNIRELENTVVRAAALCDRFINPNDLPERLRCHQEADLPDVSRDNNGAAASLLEEWPTLAEWEKHYVAKVLVHTKGNKQAAARLLGVDRKTIERMIKRYQLGD